MRLILALIFILLAAPASATMCSTGFGSTSGIGTTDSLKTTGNMGAVSNTAVSVCFKVFFNTVSTTQVQLVTGPISVYNLGAFGYNVQTNFSTTAGVYRGSHFTASAWHDFCATYDGSSTANVPTCFLDGSSYTCTKNTTPVGSFLNAAAPVWIGNQSGGAGVHDGKLADVAFWSGILLNSTQVKAYHAGMSPLKIAPGLLTFFAPVCGSGMGQSDWGPSRLSYTTTGTKTQPGLWSDGYPLLGFDQ